MHENQLKTCGFFKTAAPVLHTGHAVLRCNPHIPSAIFSGADRRLSSHLSSGLRGKGYWYHTVLSSFDSIFSCNLYSLDFSGYIMEPCGYQTRENCQQNDDMRITIDCITVSPRLHYDTLYKIRKKPGVMESYWCERKNSIVNWINYSEDFEPAPIPCLKSECDRWNNGECFNIRKVGNNCSVMSNTFQ